ncbi:hypothetical protein NP493_374g02019 [Ridgeia piscesae]|uniref:Uncharacterized protein n=1 Tax=Ridgeia piscesae TaxID=27915 RepID=A0AAD9L2P5_RIDPI|nr:hypothetical protein NP493_374g02019 [Ridgeia piscesae]
MFHDRWSKKVMLPRGDQWGKGASSVAQCMVWDYGYPKKPATQQVRNDVNNNNNRSRQGQRYKPRTSVKFEPKLEDTATSRISGQLHAERVAAVRAPTPVTCSTQTPAKSPPTPIQAWGVASPPPRGDWMKGSINEDRLVAAMKDYARHTPGGGTVLSDFYAAPRPPTGLQQRPESRTGAPGESSFSNARFVRVKSSGASRPSSAPVIRRPPPTNRNTTMQNDYAAQRAQVQQYRPPFRPAGGAHFAKWRPLSPPTTPEVRNWWRMSKFTKNAHPKVATSWENGATGPIKVRQLGPRQVNFTMECPEESDMIVSIRLRTASSQN